MHARLGNKFNDRFANWRPSRRKRWVGCGNGRCAHRQGTTPPGAGLLGGGRPTTVLLLKTRWHVVRLNAFTITTLNAELPRPQTTTVFFALKNLVATRYKKCNALFSIFKQPWARHGRFLVGPGPNTAVSLYFEPPDSLYWGAVQKLVAGAKSNTGPGPGELERWPGWHPPRRGRARARPPDLPLTWGRPSES